jgi:hypothetical protein
MVYSDIVIQKRLEEYGGKDVKALRLETDSRQSALDEGALRLMKDNSNEDYTKELLQSALLQVEQSKRDSYHLLTDDLSPGRYVSRLSTPYYTATPKEKELCLSPRDKSIRDMSRGKYQHIRANRPSWTARPILKPVVPQEDNRTWKYWLGEIPTNFQGAARRVEVAKHLDQIIEAVEAVHKTNPPTRLNHSDNEGETLLHAFISLIDPHTMGSNDVQETLQVILSCGGFSLHERNKHGETPLHLAIRMALPHVVATLLRHLVKSEPVNGEVRAGILREAIEVSDNDKTSLFTDLHLTYWLARYSDEPDALQFEIDALICIRIIINAMVGHTPPEKHNFREFRNVDVFTERPPSKRPRRQPNGTSSIHPGIAKRCRSIASAGGHLQRQNYIGVSQEVLQNPTTATYRPSGSDMSFQQNKPLWYHGPSYMPAPASDTVSERYHHFKRSIC